MKRIYPKILRGEPSAQRNDIAPGGMGNKRLYRNFAWLWLKVCAIQGASVAESIVSECSVLSPSRVAGIRTLVGGNWVMQDETSITAN